MMKNLIVIILTNLNGLVFGQQIQPLPAASPILIEVTEVPTATICYAYPDHEAYFPDGTEVFVKKLKSKISTDGLKLLKSEDNFKSILQFIVDRDGTISEIRIIGTNKKFNNVVELAAKRIKGKWVPAKKDGSLVKSRMQIPIIMNLH